MSRRGSWIDRALATFERRGGGYRHQRPTVSGVAASPVAVPTLDAERGVPPATYVTSWEVAQGANTAFAIFRVPDGYSVQLHYRSTQGDARVGVFFPSVTGIGFIENAAPKKWGADEQIRCPVQVMALTHGLGALLSLAGSMAIDSSEIVFTLPLVAGPADIYMEKETAGAGQFDGAAVLEVWEFPTS